MTNKNKHFFTRHLTEWHATQNNRSLPWKNEKDPYKIWLSEVILQQTRALQALPYYMRFIEKYPSVNDLAKANDEEVFRLWQGLGYYNRCKNMLATARLIIHEFGGRFPSDHKNILQLKGIGPYTAAAIASFAFGLPYAVVDGNVYRVLSRYFGIDTPFDSTEGKKTFAELAQELLDTKDSAAYNQAIMDLGATVCTPQNPLCDECPLQKNCMAHNHNLTDILPVRSKKLAVRKRYFHYLLLQWKDTIWIRKRTGNDIWENLHEPYLIEHTEPIDEQALSQHKLIKEAGILYNTIKYEGHYSQRLTHQLIESRFYSITLKEKPKMESTNGKWIYTKDLDKMAFPKTLVSFLKK